MRLTTGPLKISTRDYVGQHEQVQATQENFQLLFFYKDEHLRDRQNAKGLNKRLTSDDQSLSSVQTHRTQQQDLC